MKGPMASKPTAEMFPPDIAKRIATPETQTRAAKVAMASARSARRLLSLEGRSSSRCSGTVLGGSSVADSWY